MLGLVGQGLLSGVSRGRSAWDRWCCAGVLRGGTLVRRATSLQAGVPPRGRPDFRGVPKASNLGFRLAQCQSGRGDKEQAVGSDGVSSTSSPGNSARTLVNAAEMGKPPVPRTASRPLPPAHAKEYSGSYYKAFNDHLTWHQARDKCREMGGQLAVVKSQEENRFLTSLIQGAGLANAWLGATDEVVEGRWVWVDGSEMRYNAWDVKQKQPNNSGGGGLKEHCLILMSPSGLWWDLFGEAGHGWKPGYVCQWVGVGAKQSRKGGLSVACSMAKTPPGGRHIPPSRAIRRVENGILIGSGPKTSHLYTERDDYTDFRLSIRARISDGGNGGVYVRAPFGPARPARHPAFPRGYEAQINSTHRDPNKTGSLFVEGEVVRSIPETPVFPGQWFDMEVIARNDRVVVKVNGEITVDYLDRNAPLLARTYRTATA